MGSGVVGVEGNWMGVYCYRNRSDGRGYGGVERAREAEPFSLFGWFLWPAGGEGRLEYLEGKVECGPEDVYDATRCGWRASWTRNP